MTFKDIRGHDRLIEELRSAILEDSVPHAFLIESSRSVDKEAFAFSFAEALLCRREPGIGCGICPICRKIMDGNHLDVTVIRAVQKGKSSVASVRDEDVERMLERLGQKPVEGDRNVAIVCDADSMTARAQNRLLKSLEEPAPGTVIMLLADNAENLLPTVRSRCVKIRLASRADEKTGEAAGDAVRFLQLAEREGRYFEAREIIEKYSGSREQAMLFIDAVEEALGRAMKAAGGSQLLRRELYHRVEVLEQARDEIKRGEVAAHSLKKMTIAMGEQIL